MLTSRRAAVVLTALIGISATPAAVAAQWMPTSEERPNALWGELGFYAGGFTVSGAEVNASVVSPLILGRFHLLDRFEVGFSWGFVHSVLSMPGSEDETAFMIGNPSLSSSYRIDLEGAELRLGFGIALPVASVGEEGTPLELLARATALTLAAATRAQWNAWSWVPDRLTIAAPWARIDSGPGGFVWAVEVALGTEVYTGDADESTELVTQIAGEAGARLGSHVTLGSRFSLVWIPTAEGDNAQTALEPYLRFESGALFSAARFTLNLDHPLGFALDQNRVWGMHVGGGALF